MPARHRTRATPIGRLSSFTVLAGALLVARRALPVESPAPCSAFAFIFRLNAFWDRQGCVLLQPYDMEVGAGTFHTATFLRAIGPEPWKAAYVQPSRRPKDGRYGETPNRLQHYYQYQVVLKPSPADIQDIYIASLRELGIDPLEHDIRFVEDDWESPTLGAWGLGWRCGSTAWRPRSYLLPGSRQPRSSLCSARSPMASSGSRCTFRTRRASTTPCGRLVSLTAMSIIRTRWSSRATIELSNAEILFRHFEYEAEAKRLIERSACSRPTRGHEVLAHLQPARCARRDLGH